MEYLMIDDWPGPTTVIVRRGKDKAYECYVGLACADCVPAYLRGGLCTDNPAHVLQWLANLGYAFAQDRARREISDLITA